MATAAFCCPHTGTCDLTGSVALVGEKVNNVYGKYGAPLTPAQPLWGTPHFYLTYMGHLLPLPDLPTCGVRNICGTTSWYEKRFKPLFIGGCVLRQSVLTPSAVLEAGGRSCWVCVSPHWRQNQLSWAKQRAPRPWSPACPPPKVTPQILCPVSSQEFLAWGVGPVLCGLILPTEGSGLCSWRPCLAFMAVLSCHFLWVIFPQRISDAVVYTG